MEPMYKTGLRVIILKTNDLSFRHKISIFVSIIIKNVAGTAADNGSKNVPIINNRIGRGYIFFNVSRYKKFFLIPKNKSEPEDNSQNLLGIEKYANG